MPKDNLPAPVSPRLELPKTPPTPLTPTQRRHHVSDADTTSPSGQDVLLFLIGSRLLNALIIQTFFQPDEYFQALEPAWALAFGADAGAWITWEWKEHLRSAIHPSLFAVCYLVADGVSNILSLSAPYRAHLLLAAPKTLQAVIAALGDYYTWRLAESTYGIRSLAPAAALVVTVASPWQWFCSTRTFSNSLETTLTIVALYNWPWQWSAKLTPKDSDGLDEQGLRKRKAVTPSHGSVDETTRLRRALFFAALATILRPTNVLIWVALLCITLVQSQRSEPPNSKQVSAVSPQGNASQGLSRKEITTFLREALLCGSLVLSLSAIIDRLFYKTWTFPAYNFLLVNVIQSIAGFYGNNNWHYYLTQGYPLLLTTALPFTLSGMYRTFFSDQYRNLSQTSRNTLSSLTGISLLLPTALSLISHKEVRFIYPLLPMLHVLSAHPIASFFASAFDNLRTYSRNSQLSKRFLLTLLLLLNLSISLYTATIHNSGLINVTHYLRSEFETYYLPHHSTPAQAHHNMTIAFLTPCHSTPWRSHLQHPPTSLRAGIDAWALTCEPPINLSPAEKATYLDEADQFYLSPADWLKRHMSRSPPVTHHTGTIPGPGPILNGPKPRRMFEVETSNQEQLWRERKGRRPWPEYLVFFEQLEPEMKRLVGRASGYGECWRGWNSRGHEDWRRQGAVVVWCLFPERRVRDLEGNGERGTDRGKVNVNVNRNVNAGSQRERERDRAVGPGASGFWKQIPLLGKGSTEQQQQGWIEWAKTKVGLGEKKRKRWFWER